MRTQSHYPMLSSRRSHHLHGQFPVCDRIIHRTFRCSLLPCGQWHCGQKAWAALGVVEVSLHPSVPGAVHLLHNTLGFTSPMSQICPAYPCIPFDSLKKYLTNTQNKHLNHLHQKAKENEYGLCIISLAFTSTASWTSNATQWSIELVALICILAKHLWGFRISRSWG